MSLIATSVMKDYKPPMNDLIEATLEQASLAQKKWKLTSISERKKTFKQISNKLLENSQELAELMHQEMGKTLKEGVAEVEKSAAALKHFSQKLDEFLSQPKIQEKDLKAEIRIDPLGLVFAIMPWNFPLWQSIRAFLPIIAVGNSFILKPSDLVPKTTELFMKLINEVLPKGLASHLLLSHDQAAQLIKDPRISAVTMTGSSRGGREVARVASENLKKVVLELGGSDAYLILDDADLSKSADLCAQSRLINAGQSCICAKRFLVPEAQLQEWLTYFKNSLSRLEKDLAPLAHEKFKTLLKKQTEKIKAEGGELYWQGSGPNTGAHMPPEIWLITGKENFHREEEFFGPVALVIPYKTLEQALEIANGTIYGLGGAVFSKDLKRAKEVGLRLDCGLLALNDFNRSDVRLPFGGVRSSGFGRELGPWPLFEFANVRAVTGDGL